MKIYLMIHIFAYVLSICVSIFYIYINKDRQKSLFSLLFSLVFLTWAISLYMGVK